MLSLSRYRACILLGAVGDTVGYHNGDWEFNYNTQKIRREFLTQGGSQKLDVASLSVSDDTVLHLATISSLIKSHNVIDPETELKIATHEFIEAFKDMSGRAPGTTTSSSISILKRGQRPEFNLNHKTCGGSMRAAAIGLRYHNFMDVDQLQRLIWTSIEYCRLTHNGPLAYMGSFLNALFTAYAINHISANQWILMAIATKPLVLNHINSLPNPHLHYDYIDWVYGFLQNYQNYRYPKSVKFDNQDAFEWDSTQPYFYEMDYIDNPKDMERIYDWLSEEPNDNQKDYRYHWAGAGGYNSVMIAYDALIYSIYNHDLYNPDLHEQIYHQPELISPEYFQDTWYLVMMCGMLHSGDNDSTGIIAGGWYGALFGARGVSRNLVENLEYFDYMWTMTKDLHQISTTDQLLTPTFIPTPKTPPPPPPLPLLINLSDPVPRLISDWPNTSNSLNIVD